jgi:hypothetical protein
MAVGPVSGGSTTTYDSYGVRTVKSGYRSPWPFLSHGLEQEYYDSKKLYWSLTEMFTIRIRSSSRSVARKASEVAAEARFYEIRGRSTHLQCRGQSGRVSER